jgi:acylglycerol lipase
MYITKLISAFIPLIAACSTSASAGEGAAGITGEWETFDGSTFPYTKWLPASGTKLEAIVVCVHGISGAASDFEQLGEKLSRRGMAVFAYELRGQGNDPKERRIGDIRRRKHWSCDLDRFMSYARIGHAGLPVFIYGESLGALILMHSFAELDQGNRNVVEGLVFASPVVALPAKLPPVKNFLLHVAVKLLPCVKVSLMKLSGDDEVQVTDEGNHWDQMEDTPHFVRRYSLRMLGIVEKMVDSCSAVAAKIRKPILVLYPGKDVFTTPTEVEEFYSELGSTDKSKQLYPESHHLLAYDTEREAVFKRVLEWIEERS